MIDSRSNQPTRPQKDAQKELQENFLMWIIRYVMIPIVLASIAGFFAIAVVDRSFQHEQGQANDPAFTEIFGTMTAAAINAPPTPSLAATQTATAVPTQTPDPSTGETNTANKPLNTSVPTQPVVPVVCPAPPAGWQLYTVQPGNTLFSLARETGTTVEAIRQVNCLYGELLAYSQIWLPNAFVGRPDPTVTATATATATEPTSSPLPDLINDTRDWPSFFLSCPEECIPVISFAANNVGAGAAGPFNIRLQFTASSGSLVTLDQAVASMTPNGGTSFALADAELRDCYDLGCLICITVDNFNQQIEENEANNQYCETFLGRGEGRG